MTDSRPDTEAAYDAWAWLYDRTLGPAYRDRKMAFLERALLSELPPSAHVLDLCCGTGQMIAPMAAHGFAVTGIDLSADMLRHAALNVPQAVLKQGDARDFTLDRPVAGAVCASASLNHIPGLDDLERVFRSVHAALEDGGIFVFDINHPAQMTRHWLGQPAAGEIAADYAWMITPRYDPASATGAFRVDMYRRPDGASSTGPALWRKLLSRPLMRWRRMALLADFARRHPDWDHRGEDYPIHGHDLAGVRERLEAAGFDVRMETFSGKGAVDADNAACFIARKRPAASAMEAAE
ncbi:methyltransferase domain-containing protein [Paracoccus caeni]|uniref:Methyltransferase domain-containing protein n=1 Tax=Paracoccus caeni TaxID=657651 RepID=A0A934SBS5_9RHOB|nr:class I SAM-dependent methyltransferase [Paracoccus caeni]MBK4215975.1 methyltransferase domain-containing protein [Paracoccus caeni]